MKASIVIANYNNSKYIDECIESLYNQTYKDLEIIFFDDNSHDNSIDIIKNYKNVKIIENKNQTKFGSFNQMNAFIKGIRYSTGRISTETVKGFTALHYDLTPSPLGGSGGGLFGQGGVLAGGLDVVGDVLEGNIFTDPLALLGTAIKAKNTYDKAQQLSSEGIRNEVRGIVTNSVTNAVNQTVRISGVDKFDQNQATVGNVTTTNTPFNPNARASTFLEASEGAEIPSSRNSTT